MSPNHGEQRYHYDDDGEVIDGEVHQAVSHFLSLTIAEAASSA